MSILATSSTVLGVRIANTMFLQTKSRRGCDHPMPEDERARFCPICGRKLYETFEDEVDFEELQDNQYVNICYDTDMENVFVGCVFFACSSRNESYHSFNSLTQLQRLVDDTESHKQLIRCALEALDFRTESELDVIMDTYNLYTVLDISY